MKVARQSFKDSYIYLFQVQQPSTQKILVLSDVNTRGFRCCCCGLVLHPPELVENLRPIGWRPGPRCGTGVRRSQSWCRGSVQAFLPPWSSVETSSAASVHGVSFFLWFSGTHSTTCSSSQLSRIQHSLSSYNASYLLCISSPANVQALYTSMWFEKPILSSCSVPCVVLASKVQG